MANDLAVWLGRQSSSRDRVEDPVPRRRGDTWPIVEDERHEALGHPGPAGDIDDRGAATSRDPPSTPEPTDASGVLAYDVPRILNRFRILVKARTTSGDGRFVLRRVINGRVRRVFG